MKKETILKLLKSSNYDDVILGLNYMKDYTWEQLRELETNYLNDSIKIYVNVRGSSGKDNYLFNGDIYCHYNAAINIYNGDREFKHIEYIQL